LVSRVKLGWRDVVFVFIRHVAVSTVSVDMRLNMRCDKYEAYIIRLDVPRGDVKSKKRSLSKYRIIELSKR